jgi:aldose sugar dehydrogenase
MRLSFPLALALTAILPTMSCSAAPANSGKLPFAIEEVGKFDEPWALEFLPGDKGILITEKSGKLQWLPKRGQPPVLVTGVPKVAYGGQGGFGDVVVHPNFTENGMVYLSWAESGEGGNGAVVARAKLVTEGRQARLDGLNIIWRQFPKVSGKGHYGHRIAFGPDGKLYISSGERQKFTPAQDMKANLGKMIRLNNDGTVPADNPFFSEGGVTAQIWAKGLRNPLGIAFDADGRLWEVEMGPANGDEVNLIKSGANYGYPNVSNGDHYDGRDIPDHSPSDGFAAPKIWWNPGIAPAGMMIYKGDLFKNWTGDAFIGALGGQALIRIDLNGELAIKGDEWDMGERIRDVDQATDGSIWIIEDGSAGRLLRLTPKP